MGGQKQKKKKLLQFSLMTREAPYGLDLRMEEESIPKQRVFFDSGWNR